MTNNQRRYGVRVPDGFNGSQIETINALLEMTAFTVETNQLFNGFTAELKRSPLGEWRYTVTPRDKNE